MNTFKPLFHLELKRRSKDFFILFYTIVFPTVIIFLLGYLTSTSYGTQFTSYEYYAIVTIPFCLLMGITSVAYAAGDEKRAHTAYRYMISPISNSSLVIAKFLSCTITLTLCSIITLTISTLFFHLPAPTHFSHLILLFLSEAIAVSGIGLFFGLACKNFAIIQNFINIPIMIFGFLGGAFFPVNSTDTTLSHALLLSPLTWINHSIIHTLYTNQSTLLFCTSTCLIIIGLLFTTLTITYFKKEAFI